MGASLLAPAKSIYYLWTASTKCTSCTSLSNGFSVKCVLKCGVECRQYLEANFCFFEKCELRTSPWSPSWFEVGTVYPLTHVFTFKVGSKYILIILESSSVKPNMVKDSFFFLQCFCFSLIFVLLLLFFISKGEGMIYNGCIAHHYLIGNLANQVKLKSYLGFHYTSTFERWLSPFSVDAHSNGVSIRLFC